MISENYLFVGATGFEPTTPCSQSRCANRTALRPEKTLRIATCHISSTKRRTQKSAAKITIKDRCRKFVVHFLRKALLGGTISETINKASSQIRQAKHTLTQKRLRRKNTITAQPLILLYSFCMQVSISRAERVCSQSPILPRFCVRTASAYCREPDRDICAGQIHPVSRQILDG